MNMNQDLVHKLGDNTREFLLGVAYVVKESPTFTSWQYYKEVITRNKVNIAIKVAAVTAAVTVAAASGLGALAIAAALAGLVTGKAVTMAKSIAKRVFWAGELRGGMWRKLSSMKFDYEAYKRGETQTLNLPEVVAFSSLITDTDLTEVADAFRSIGTTYTRNFHDFPQGRNPNDNDEAHKAWWEYFSDYFQAARATDVLLEKGMVNIDKYFYTIYTTVHELMTREFSPEMVSGLIAKLNDHLAGAHPKCVRRRFAPDDICYKIEGGVPYKPYSSLRDFEKTGKYQNMLCMKLLNDAANWVRNRTATRITYTFLSHKDESEWIEKVLSLTGPVVGLYRSESREEEALTSVRFLFGEGDDRTRLEASGIDVGSRFSAAGQAIGAATGSLAASGASTGAKIAKDALLGNVIKPDPVGLAEAGLSAIAEAANTAITYRQVRTGKTWGITTGWRAQSQSGHARSLAEALKQEIADGSHGLTYKFCGMLDDHFALKEYMSGERKIDTCEEAYNCAVALLSRQKRFIQLAPILDQLVKFHQIVVEGCREMIKDLDKGGGAAMWELNRMLDPPGHFMSRRGVANLNRM